MPYGTVKVDNITFDQGGADQNVTASGIYRAITSGVTVTGTISGAVLVGTTTVSGATVTGTIVQATTVQGVSGTFTSLTGTTTTGTTANFVSGVFTTRVSGATITGTTAQFTSGTFVSLTGTTITGTTISGTTVSSTTGTFTSLTGTTITGTTVNGTTVNSITGNFTSLTGVTVTGTTANFVSGVFTTQVSGATVTGTQSSFTSGNFVTLSGATATFTSGVIASGTAAAPSLSIVSDPNTGIYSTAADTLAFVEGGVEAMRIDSSGRLGIGTSAPAELLNVNGNIALDTVALNAPKFLQFRANSDGTGTPSYGGITWYNFQWDATERAEISSGPDGGVAAGYLAFSTGSGGISERLRINATGQVGIGTSSPNRQLEVSLTTLDNFIRVNTTGATKSGIEFSNGGAVYSQLYFDNTPPYDFSLLQQVATGSLILGTNNTERARIDTSGRLLVGTSSARLISSAFLGGGGAIAELQVEGIALAMGSFASNRNDNFGPYLALVKSRGTAAGSFTLVSNGDGIGALSFNGTDGSAALVGAAISAFVDGTPGANDMPGRLVFSTTADGAASPTEAMRIKSTRIINFSNAPTHADNTAAAAAGLAVGDVYKTVLGVLMIRF